jgi:Domain of unknown function (DUF5655)
MTSLKYVKPERIYLKNHSEFGERWVQERIAEDPSLLGLGDLVLKDKERRQPRRGRLDLLLQDPESYERYEVEIQLGKTDEAHIIRTIEYWDEERKRYPQYDHFAVIVAEDITSRFLNVINLFNGQIPLIALQMSALRIEDRISLIFTTVIDVQLLGLVDEDEEVQVPADRAYWENRASKATLSLADKLLEMLQEWDDQLSLNYRKGHIGLARNGRPNNFVAFIPRKDWLTLYSKLERSDELEAQIEDSDIDWKYDSRYRQYQLQLGKESFKEHVTLLRGLLREAYEASL